MSWWRKVLGLPEPVDREAELYDQDAGEDADDWPELESVPVDQPEDEPEEPEDEDADDGELRLIALVSGKVREGVLIERAGKKGMTELFLVDDVSGLPWPVGEYELSTAVVVSGGYSDDDE